MQDFKKLQVWQLSHELTIEVYKLSTDFPASEKYRLTDQLLRAASSVGANIAEGCGKNTNLDFARYLSIALGSISELEYHLLLMKDLAIINPELYNTLIPKVDRIRKMIFSLQKVIRKKNIN